MMETVVSKWFYSGFKMVSNTFLVRKYRGIKLNGRWMMMENTVVLQWFQSGFKHLFGKKIKRYKA